MTPERITQLRDAVEESRHGDFTSRYDARWALRLGVAEALDEIERLTRANAELTARAEKAELGLKHLREFALKRGVCGMCSATNTDCRGCPAYDGAES